MSLRLPQLQPAEHLQASLLHTAQMQARCKQVVPEGCVIKYWDTQILSLHSGTVLGKSRSKSTSACYLSSVFQDASSIFEFG